MIKKYRRPTPISVSIIIEPAINKCWVKIKKRLQNQSLFEMQTFISVNDP
jgi:hypothetical protein